MCRLEAILFEKSQLRAGLDEELEQMAKLRDALLGGSEEADKIELQRVEVKQNTEKVGFFGFLGRVLGWLKCDLQLGEELQAKEVDVATMQSRKDKLKQSVDSAEETCGNTEHDIKGKKKLLKEYEMAMERTKRMNQDQKVSNHFINVLFHWQKI